MIKPVILLSSVLLFMSSFLALAQNEKGSCSCCTDDHRSFDFWLGEWKVYAEEKLVGTNTIQLDQDSCLLIEHWRSSNGIITGTSYNFFNHAEDHWEQLWIDNQGSNLKLKGGIMEGKMIMYSDGMISRDGDEYINRITWTPKKDGSVRQHWEISKDDGETWKTFFDGLYIKKGTG